MKWEPTSWTIKGDKELIQLTIYRVRSTHWEAEKFKVKRGEDCLNKYGEMEWEPSPSNRSEGFLKRCRFNTFEEAVEIANKYLESIK